MTKISIIIPMYNEERYIWRCLESLKEQTLKDFEVILIDDGSKDKTVEIAQSFEKDFQLTILEQKHWWPWKARNRWAKEAKWDILIFVDADMYFDKNYIKELTTPIINGDEIWTSHWTELIWNIDNIRAKTRCIDRIWEIWERISIYRAIKKDVFLKAGWFNIDKWYFDDDLSHIDSEWALVVKSAKCYHNNPTNLKEAFKHEIWVWESITKRHLNKYIIICLIICAIITLICILNKNHFLNIITFVVCTLIVLIEIKAFKNLISNKILIKKHKLKNKWYSLINYIRSFPILFFTRVMWMIFWITKSIHKK